MKNRTLKPVPVLHRNQYHVSDPASVGGFPSVPPTITYQDEPKGGRYRFKFYNGGASVLIYAPYVADRSPVAVELMDGDFAFMVKSRQRATWVPGGVGYSSRIIPTIKFFDLLNEVSTFLLHDWQSPEAGPGFPMMHTWAAKKTATAIGKRLSNYWNDVCAQVDQAVLDTQRAVFAACGPSMQADNLLEPGLYANKYFVQDVIRYRSAALLVGRPDLFDVCRPWTFANWRTAYSYDRKSVSRSLNKTLDRIPGAVPPQIVGSIQSLNLDRSLDDRMVMFAYGYAANRFADDDYCSTAFEILDRSSADQIRRAIQMVNRNLTGKVLDMRRQKEILENLHIIYDYHPYLQTDAARNATIVGWAEASLENHEELHKAAVLEYEARKAEPTCAPPIPLPDDPRITFLDSVGAILEEGALMGHCVGGYSDLATKGRCFLFHVELDGGDKATGEVGADGSVRQVRGPRNKNNKAAEYGKKALKKWGRQLAKASPVGTGPEVSGWDEPLF